METMVMTATANTWLKRRHDTQAEDLIDAHRIKVAKGKKAKITFHQESDARSAQAGHVVVQLEGRPKRWYAFVDHWQMPWEIVDESMEEVDGPFIIKPGDVDWNKWDSKVSKFFTVGEVTNHSRRRLPIRDDGNFSAAEIQENILAIAQHLDRIREWWKGPIGVNSWYRPWAVNNEIGSRTPNHPGGYGVDIRPLHGSVYEFQKKFVSQWWEKGKWQHGLGLGAHKGFMHLDLRSKRSWGY